MYAWLDLQKTALTTALFGPWPNSSMRLAEVVRHCHRRLATARCGALAFFVYTIRRGVRHRHQVPALGAAKHHQQFCISHRAWAMEGAQDAATSLPVHLRFEGRPRYQATAVIRWRLRQLKSPGRWRWRHGELSQLPKAEVVLVAKFHRLDRGSSLPLHNTNIRLIQYSFMLPLEVVGPGGSLSMLLLPRLNGKMLSESTPAGSNGDDGI